MMDNNLTWPGWKIVRSLGEGSYGEVFEINRVEGSNVFREALKVIRIPQNAYDVQSLRDDGMDEQSIRTYLESLVNDIREEYALMAKVRGCPNIVTYYDHLIYEDKNKIGWDILIKMELLKPFKTYIKENGLSEAVVKKAGIDLCKALEACQKQKIIHRDIKPDNMFINDYGDIKLGDFGIARTLENTSTMMTRIGTYPYMAPEIYYGGKADFSADIYSVGMVMYRLLNENIGPFETSTKNRTTKSRQEAEEKRFKGLKLPYPKYGSRPMKDIILCATQHDPAKRFRNPAAMRAALEQVAASDVLLEWLKGNSGGGSGGIISVVTVKQEEERRKREEEERRKQEEERRKREEEERRKREEEEEERRKREEEERRRREAERRKKIVFRIIIGLAGVLVTVFSIFIAVYIIRSKSDNQLSEPEPEPDSSITVMQEEEEDPNAPKLLVDSSVMLLGDAMTIRFYNGENTYAYGSDLTYYSDPNTVDISADKSKYRCYITANSTGWTTVTGEMGGLELSKDILVIDAGKAKHNVTCDTQKIIFQVTGTGGGAANLNFKVEGWSGGDLEARFYTNAGRDFKGDVWVTAKANWEKKNELKATVKNYLSSEKNGELVVVITEKGDPESLVGTCRIPIVIG